MTLDINSNGSYFYNGNKKNKDKEDESEEKKKDNEKENESSEKHSYQKKSADASSLEVLGMQNALMIHQESIVHNPHKHSNPDDNINSQHSDNSHETLNHNGPAGHSDFHNNISHNAGSNIQNNLNQSGSANKVDNGVSDNSENNDLLSKIGDYENFGIVKNSDGTFSVKNNPFGKFTKTTIEDYINKYIIPSMTDSWINGYSKLYTINSKKILLMKVTSKSGNKAFKGRIIENGEKYIIFYGVNEKGLPDENNIIKKLKIDSPEKHE